MIFDVSTDGVSEWGVTVCMNIMSAQQQMQI